MIKKKRLSTEEFDAIFLQEYTALKLYASNILYTATGRYDLGRVEDAVQDTFWTLWKRSEEYLSHPFPEKWLYKTLAFSIKNIIKIDTRWELRLLQMQETLENKNHSQLGAGLELEGMIPQDERDLLIRVYITGDSREEVAQELGITRAALDKRISRSKEKFRKEYKEDK